MTDPGVERRAALTAVSRAVARWAVGVRAGLGVLVAAAVARGQGGAAGTAGAASVAGAAGAKGPAGANGGSVMLGTPPGMESPDSWVEPFVPASLREGKLLGLEPWQWLGLLVVVGGGWLVATLGAKAAVTMLNRLARRAIPSWDERILLSERRPVRLVLMSILVGLGVRDLALPARPELFLGHLAYTGLVVGVAWMLLGAINTGMDVYAGSLPDDTIGEFRSRSTRTRLAVARSVGSVLLLLASVAVLLMQFEVVRSVGVSLLASAGVAGVVLGFAAQKSLGGVIAGLQLSIAQPVRIGDLVHFEGETGVIEEINLTYVVIALWDERRLVVPISKFLETNLQNWSRGENPVLAWVTLHADPTLPVGRLREAMVAYCQGNPRCDSRDVGLVVTDMNIDAIVIRVHASCAQPADVALLRAELREAMVATLASLDDGRYLPRRRQLVMPPDHASPGAP